MFSKNTQKRPLLMLISDGWQTIWTLYPDF